MAKTLVVDLSDNTRVPFLRGILIRSLHDAGLGFEEAYKLASDVRQDLSAMDEITTVELQQRVIAALGQFSTPEIVEAYQVSGRLPAPIIVRDADGQETPFSRGQHTQCLESSGLSTKDAEKASRHIYQYLLDNDIAELSSSRLGHLTYVCLNQKMGREVARRYMVWVDYTHKGRPLILLLGGTTGCGKSSIATELAHSLGVVRTQSTDMLREVMRMMIPQRLLPVLHASSFNAGDLLPVTESSADEIESQVAGGYLTQSELLSVPCEAVVQRALRERVSLILEGVHVHPGLLEHMEATGDAVVVMVTLAVLKREQLRARLSGRLVTAPQREASGHLDRFEKIWRLQSFLLSEADRAGIPILVNDRKEGATNLIMKTIIDELGKTFDKTPEEVFGAAA